MTGRWARGLLNGGMSRRCFLKAAGATAVVAATGALGCAGPQATVSPTLAPTRVPSAPAGKMVVATDPDPAKLVDKALDAYGGLSGIVSNGDRVFVKANYSFARTKAQAACNHPGVLVRILQRCKEAGAAEVTVIDHTIENGRSCLETSGIRAAVEAAGFKALAVNGADEYVEQQVPCGKQQSIRVPRLLLDADVLIDAPVIKSHGTTAMTASMKNLMGLVFDRSALHWPGPLDQCIVDLAKALRPTLVIADAYRVLKTGGPGGGSKADVIEEPYQVLVGGDMVAVDAFAAGYLGLRPEDVEHVSAAFKAGLGEIDPARVDLIRV